MKTVIEMAREAGLHRQQHNLMSNPLQYRFSYDGYEENLERFAELVRADAIADEREACAKLADKVEYCGACESDVAWAIRAMGSRAVGNMAYDRYEGE